ncbi:hypothetical protein EON67_11385 [archaeon]|nr:MAG: hypothetical protein EON67_11385 [archaeon]
MMAALGTGKEARTATGGDDVPPSPQVVVAAATAAGVPPDVAAAAPAKRAHSHSQTSAMQVCRRRASPACACTQRVLKYAGQVFECVMGALCRVHQRVRCA